MVVHTDDVVLKAALQYAAHGWPVFPLRGKLPAKPRTAGGRGFRDATTDPAVVERMWARYPDANVGVRCGLASGLAVVDIDPVHGGVDTLTRIESERGVLPGTVMAITGGDGLHLLFRHRAGIGCGANVWGRGLDLRGGTSVPRRPSTRTPATATAGPATAPGRTRFQRGPRSSYRPPGRWW